jgi:hypothetical protein
MKSISCCGIDCSSCEAKIATDLNDDQMRSEIAEKWRQTYNSPSISAKDINCVGCRQEGVKFSHCLGCNIKKCAKDNGFEHCGQCDRMDSCLSIKAIHTHVPQARVNLLKLQ